MLLEMDDQLSMIFDCSIMDLNCVLVKINL